MPTCAWLSACSMFCSNAVQDAVSTSLLLPRFAMLQHVLQCIEPLAVILLLGHFILGQPLHPQCMQG